MSYYSETIEINRPSQEALSLFGDPLRLPEWAIEFCQGVERIEDGYLAQTVEGPRYVDTRLDRETGVTDICTGASPDVLNDILYIRVTPLGDQRAHVNMVWMPKPETPADVIEMGKNGLRKELEHSKRLLELAGGTA